jgi:sarcosine oxidase
VRLQHRPLVGGRAEEQVLRTKRLLCSTGGWTGQLIHSWAPYLRPIRQLQSFLQVDQNLELFSYEQMPAWFMVHPHFHLPQYGVPCDTDEKGCESWLKIAMHGRDDFLPDPAQNHQRKVTTAEEKEAFHASSFVFDLDRLKSSGSSDPEWAFAKIVPCFYTMTKDQHFILGTPQDQKNVFAVSGLSGHGYKMAPALGQMMTKDMTQWNMEFCSPARFGV